MMRTNERRGLAKLAALTAALVLTLAGCSGQETEGGAEVTDLTVGIVPVVDHAAVFQAIEKGYFEEVGLTVNAQPAQGGAAALPAMIAGDMQVAFATYPSFLLAQQNTAPVRFVGLGVDGTEATSGVYAMPDSGIAEPGDLAGRTIAVNTLNNSGDITTRSVLQEAGVDPASVTFVELPFPDMLAAVEEGNVDAAWVVEPFQSAFIEKGLHKVIENYSGRSANIPVSGLAMTADFVDQNPTSASKFSEAIQRANADLAADPDIARDLVLEYSEVSEEVARNMQLPTWVEGPPTAEKLEIWNTLMVDQEVLDGPVDIHEMVLSSE